MPVNMTVAKALILVTTEMTLNSATVVSIAYFFLQTIFDSGNKYFLTFFRIFPTWFQSIFSSIILSYVKTKQ